MRSAVAGSGLDAVRGGEALFDAPLVAAAVREIGQPLLVVEREGRLGVARVATDGATPGAASAVRGYVSPCRLRDLGEDSFRADHGLRLCYVAGAMANGIGSVEILEALGRQGMLGFFGSAGLSLAEVERAIDRLDVHGGGLPFGFNLIHSPAEPALEDAVVDLYLRRNVRLVEASAFLGLTPAVVRYRVSGIHRDAAGRIVAPNRVIAKVSRVEVAEMFLAPPPERMLGELVAQGVITEEQARWARRIPVAQDLTAEADSAGHTDNRPALALLPTMLALRDRMQEEHGYELPLRVGAAGGIATPAAAAAAFSMGAAWVLTGSVNQACLEAGTSDVVRQMLAETQQADIAMAPAADMFETGVKVQVLKRATMYAMRSGKLYQLYRDHDSLEDIPADERARLEKTVFRSSLDEIWDQTRRYFEQRDPGQVARAERDAKQKMALVFRWYLGHSSRWANSGEPSRKIDYQVWCGPAMPAFNEWVRGSFLAEPEQRRVAVVGLNIMYGAAVYTRAHQLRCQGLHLPPGVLRVEPLESRLLEQVAAAEAEA